MTQLITADDKVSQNTKLLFIYIILGLQNTTTVYLESSNALPANKEQKDKQKLTN